MRTRPERRRSRLDVLDTATLVDKVLRLREEGVEWTALGDRFGRSPSALQSLVATYTRRRRLAERE